MIDFELMTQMEQKCFHLQDKQEQIAIDKDPEAINEKYQKGEVRIVTEQARYPLNTITQLVDSKRYILRPEFQRRHRWDVYQKSRLIESFIINIPIPPIFLYERDYSEFEVMDGLQRVTAICEFYQDRFALEGLTEWPELNGLKYSELPFKIRLGIDRRYLSSIILLKETAKDPLEAEKLKQLVFERINSGGAKLEYQESRNALYPSEFNKSLIRMARNPYFCEIFDIPMPSDDEDLDQDIFSEELKHNTMFQSMRDVEIVLRFFALRQIETWESISLKRHLDRIAERAMSLPSEILPHYENLFSETIELVYHLFDDHSFCMWKYEKRLGEYRWNKQPNLVLYDPIMLVLSKMLDNRQQLMDQKEKIVEEIKHLFEGNADIFNGRNTSRTYVENRINVFSDFFNSFLA